MRSVTLRVAVCGRGWKLGVPRGRALSPPIHAVVGSVDTRASSIRGQIRAGYKPGIRGRKSLNVSGTYEAAAASYVTRSNLRVQSWSDSSYQERPETEA